MSDLKNIDKQILENLFQMQGGWVLDFTDRAIREFFMDELNVDIFDEKYNYASGSKANRIRGFWTEADNGVVSNSILKLIEYIEHKIILDKLKADDFSVKKINAAKNIANKILSIQLPNLVTNNDDISNKEVKVVENSRIIATGDSIIGNEKISGVDKHKNFDHKSEFMKMLYFVFGSIVFLLLVYFIYKMTGINLNIK